MNAFPHLFAPLEVGRMRLRNRLVMTAHGTKLSGARYHRYIEERARGGVGLIGVFAGFGVYVYPTAAGRVVPYQAGDFDAVLPDPASAGGAAYYDKLVEPLLKPVAEVAHRHGAMCVGQLYHSGAVRHADNLLPTVAPSEVPDPYSHNVPHVLEEDEIADLVVVYARAAGRVERAGLDGVELHAAHGYLINQFLSPLTNRRTDRWGGSFDNRLRFLREVVAAIRREASPDFPIGLRLSAGDFAAGGLTTDDVCQVAASVSSLFAYISLSGGSYAGLTNDRTLSYVAPWYVEDGPVVDVAARVKRATNVPVMVAGRIGDPHLAERIVAEGSADLVGMVRAFIADAEFANKAQADAPQNIRRCIGNNECHVPGRPVLCAINPAAGREASLETVPAEVARRVLVVGGGPAGLETARVAALRGHQVMLAERRPALGGQLADLARDPNRADLAAYVAFQQRQLDALGVATHLGLEMTVPLVDQFAPDVVVVATGSTAYRPQVPGIDAAHVSTALEVLRGEASLGQRVLVVGGLDDHLGPPTIAEFLSDQGKQVVLICEPVSLGQGIEPSTLTILTRRLLEKDVRVEPHTTLRAVAADGVVVADTLTARQRTLVEIESVVLACGGRAEAGLARALRGRGTPIHVVGDCRAPQRLVNAVLDAARTASVI